MKLEIHWDFDTFDTCTRRAQIGKFDFLLIYVIRPSISTILDAELHSIKSTSETSLSQELLHLETFNNELIESDAILHCALGELILVKSREEVDMKNTINYVEKILINHLKPKLSDPTKILDGVTTISLQNHFRSFGGINVEKLFLDRKLVEVDRLGFSDLSESTVNRYLRSSKNLEEGVLQLNTIMKGNFSLLTSNIEI